MEEIVVDSNVLVAFFVRKDEHHPKAYPLVKEMDNGGKIFHISALVLVETIGAINRIGGRGRAERVKKQLQDWIIRGGIKLYEVTKERVEKAIDLALNYRLKGHDALILQIAAELKLPVISYDEEVAEAAAKL